MNDASLDDQRPSPAAQLARDVILSPIGGEGLVAQTIRRIGEAIGLGLFEVGTRLPSESELSDRLGISAMTLREALAVMREAGYLETRRGRQGGTYVKEAAHSVSERDAHKRIATITDEFLADLTDYRVAIGAQSAALAAKRAASADIAELRQLVERMDAVESFEEFRRYDAAFHVTIASSTGSHRLARAETELQAELTPLITAFRVGPQARRTTNEEHRKILAAIEIGDSDLAQRLVTEHLTGTAQALAGLAQASITVD